MSNTFKSWIMYWYVFSCYFYLYFCLSSTLFWI